LKKGGSAEVYRRIGDILIKVDDNGTLLTELEEEAETLGVRIKSLESQERSAKELYEKLGNEINEAIKG
jgi:prefoldin beta subunit